MTAQAFYSGDRARRQRYHDEYTGGNMPTRREWRTNEGAQMVATTDWPCRFEDCGDRRVTPGVTVIVKRDGKWGHAECPKPANQVERWNGTAHGLDFATADAADALLAEYEERQARRVPAGTVPAIGKYTIRPADEKTAAVLSVEEPTFGSFAEGTRVVSMHGSFAVDTSRPIGVHGGNSRSWLGIGLIHPDGRFTLYKSMRELQAAGEKLGPEKTTPNHRHEKLRVAVKAVRLMLAADFDTILTYGQTWAAAEGKCFVCGHGLLDETSQRLGIGPVCLKRVRTTYGA